MNSSLGTPQKPLQREKAVACLCYPLIWCTYRNTVLHLVSFSLVACICLHALCGMGWAEMQRQGGHGVEGGWYQLLLFLSWSSQHDNCCLQKHVFCFSWQHLSPKTFFLCNYTFIWKVHKAQRFASSQSTASCCLLWAKAFLFFPHQFSQPVLMKAIETDQNRSRTAEPNQRHNLAAL